MSRIKGSVTIVFSIIAALLIVAAVVFFIMQNNDTTLTFRVIDSVSRAWVWDFTARLQDKFITGYYQSDSGTKEYTFTGLEPGEFEFIITAPHYLDVSIPVVIKRGANSLEEAVEMAGYEIPGLEEVFVSKEP